MNKLLLHVCNAIFGFSSEKTEGVLVCSLFAPFILIRAKNKFLFLLT